MTLYDMKSQFLYKNAIFTICGTKQPPRRQLKEVGIAAAKIVGRNRAWSGSHLFVLLHMDRYPKYGISKILLDALSKLAGMEAINGTKPVNVMARYVRDGSVVLGKSRRCARYNCKTDFVPITHNQKYCSRYFSTKIKAFLRRKSHIGKYSLGKSKRNHA